MYREKTGQHCEIILFLFIFKEIVTPDVLYEEVIEVNERFVLQQEKCQIKKKCPVVIGTTGEKVRNHTLCSLSIVSFSFIKGTLKRSLAIASCSLVTMSLNIFTAVQLIR